MLLFIWVWMSGEGTAVIVGLSSAVKTPPGKKKKLIHHCEVTALQKPQ